MWEESFREVSAVAARQQEMVTSGQARRLGVDDAAFGHFKEVGLLVELDWDVHQVASSSIAPKYAYPYAAWLALSPELFRWERPEAVAADAVLSHESACELHALGSAPASSMVFTVPEQHPAPRAMRLHVERLGQDDVMVYQGVPVTTPHRTILDLVRDWAEHGEVGRAIADAVRRDLVDLQGLHADLAPLADRYDFPTKGPDFLGYFTPTLQPESLSLRNLRAYATLVSADRVADVRDEVLRVVAGTRSASGAAEATGPGADDEQLSWDIAAEIVGRIGWRR